MTAMATTTKMSMAIIPTMTVPMTNVDDTTTDDDAYDVTLWYNYNYDSPLASLCNVSSHFVSFRVRPCYVMMMYMSFRAMPCYVIVSYMSCYIVPCVVSCHAVLFHNVLHVVLTCTVCRVICAPEPAFTPIRLLGRKAKMTDYMSQKERQE